MKVEKIINKKTQRYAVCMIRDNKLIAIQSFKLLREAKKFIKEICSSEDVFLVRATTSFNLLDTKVSNEESND